MIDGPTGPMRVGEALYEAKFFVHQNHNLNSHAENWTMVEYNLYGDPSMIREGIELILDFSDGFESGDCSAWSALIP
jgi:hypothetical protein